MAKQYQSVDPTLLALNTAKSVLPQTKKQVPAPTTPATSQRPAFTTTPPLQAQSKTFGGITPPFNSPIGASTPQQIGQTQQQINSLPKEMPATGTKKLSVDEFAESIKQKYPEYADRDNKTLAEAMLKKYPQYNDRVEVGTPGFEGLVKTVIGDKTPLQAFITPAVRFARGIADVGAGIQEGIDTGLSKIGLIPSQEAKNKQARAKDEAITQQVLGGKGASEAVIQEGGRIAGSMIANAPAGKLGTAGKMALGATEGLLGGATYNLSTGEGAGSPINLGLSTALGAAIPGVGALAKGIAEKTPALKNTMAKRLLNSGIKITDTNKKAIVKASGKERTDLALENDIVGSIDDMITKTDEMVDNAMQQKLSTLQSIKETTPVTQTEKLIANSVITQAKRDLEELYGKAFDQITDAEKVPELQDVFNIVNNLQKTIDGGVITPAQKEALKSLYDAYNSHLKYDPAKNRILSGAEKIRLSLQEQIEEIGNKVGVDIKGLNKKIAGGYALKKGLIQAGNRMDNLNMFGLSDSQTAILSAALGGSPLQVVSAIVGKGLLESIPVKSKLAKSLYTKGLNELTSNIPTNRPTARSNISSQFASSNPPSIGGKTDDVKFPIRLKQEGMQTKGATLPKPTVKTPPVIAETGKIGVPYKVPPKTPSKPNVGSKGLPKLGKEVLEQDISKIDDSLIQETKKYKSAEEFMDSIGEDLYKLNKEAKKYRSSYPQTVEKYRIKNGILKLLGKDTGEWHKFTGGGIGKLYKLGKEQFHDIGTIERYNINTHKRLKDIVQKLLNEKDAINKSNKSLGLQDIGIDNITYTDYDMGSTQDRYIFKLTDGRARTTIYSYDNPKVRELEDLLNKEVKNLPKSIDDIKGLKTVTPPTENLKGEYDESVEKRLRYLYDSKVTEPQLKKIREQANKKPLPPLPKKGK